MKRFQHQDQWEFFLAGDFVFGNVARHRSGQ
jgi:hypothetical protein